MLRRQSLLGDVISHAALPGEEYASRVVRYAKRQDYISEKDGSLVLTPARRDLAKKAIIE